MSYDDLVWLKCLLNQFRETTGAEAPEVNERIDEILEQEITIPKEVLN